MPGAVAVERMMSRRIPRTWLIAAGVSAALALLWVSWGEEFVAEDDCLDAGGVWRNGACEGRRPGE